MKTRIITFGLLLAIFGLATGCDRDDSLPVVQTSLAFHDVSAVRTTSESGEVLFDRDSNGWTRKSKSRMHSHSGDTGSESHRHDITAPTDQSSVEQLIDTVLRMEAKAVLDPDTQMPDPDITVDLYRANNDQPSLRLRVYATSTSSGIQYRAMIDDRNEIYVVSAPEIEGIFEVIRRTENLTHGH